MHKYTIKKGVKNYQTNCDKEDVFVEKKFLNLTPKRFLCPYCGEWHEWTEPHELGYYDSISYKTSLVCSNAPIGCNKGNYEIFFHNGYCYYTTERQCGRARLELDGRIAIDSIIESVGEPTVTFKVPFVPYSNVGSDCCSDCRSMHVCNVVNLADKGDTHNMEITLGFEFEQSDYDKLAKSAILARKERELQERENALKGKEQVVYNLVCEIQKATH